MLATARLLAKQVSEIRSTNGRAGDITEQARFFMDDDTIEDAM
jgi:hypothetical protein